MPHPKGRVLLSAGRVARCLKWVNTTAQRAPCQRTKSLRRKGSIISTVGIRGTLKPIPKDMPSLRGEAAKTGPRSGPMAKKRAAKSGTQRSETDSRRRGGRPLEGADGGKEIGGAGNPSAQGNAGNDQHAENRYHDDPGVLLDEFHDLRSLSRLSPCPERGESRCRNHAKPGESIERTIYKFLLTVNNRLNSLAILCV